MAGRDIIVVGASAGGVEALKELAADLPADLPAAVFVVLHIPPHGMSVLPQILSRSGRLRASHAVDGEPIQPGRIYVAPPDTHLLIRPGAVRLSRGPRENGVRPAIDPLFRAAARTYGRRVIGVVLSGTLDDGSAGLAAIKQRGGVAIVQDPEDALYPDMPRNAMELTEVDGCLPIPQIAEALTRLALEPLPEGGEEPMPEDMEKEAEISEVDLDALQNGRRPGRPAGFGCPDCGGALWELHDGELVRFRCRVGHAWSAHSLMARQGEALEEALWIAFRALEERASLSDALADRLRKRGNDRVSRRFTEQADDSRKRAALIRETLLSRPFEAEAHPASPGPEQSGSGNRSMDA